MIGKLKYKNMRTIIVRFEIDDNDIIEQKLYNSLQCESLKDFQKLPDTKKLFESDETFRKLCKAEKSARKIKNDYIAKHNNKS